MSLYQFNAFLFTFTRSYQINGKHSAFCTKLMCFCRLFFTPLKITKRRIQNQEKEVNNAVGMGVR